MLSVIIPTKNRLSLLKHSLHSLETSGSQEIHEIIVIDDHSDRYTLNHLKETVVRNNIKTRVYTNPGNGPAAARNKGIREASGKVLLFLGDDTLVDNNLVKTHSEFHASHVELESALVGKITWSKDIKDTPFTRWLENGGPQFGFPGSESLCLADYRYFYSSNLSLKRQYLLTSGIFDEDFPFASYEDIELGYRLQKHSGLVLHYDPSIVAYHHHPVSFLESRKRMRQVGYSARILVSKHPELKNIFDFMDRILNSRLKNYMRLIIFPFAYMLGMDKFVHPFFWQVMAKHFKIGYESSFNGLSR